jgi:endo-1,4-beta-xylanase
MLSPISSDVKKILIMKQKLTLLFILIIGISQLSSQSANQHGQVSMVVDKTGNDEVMSKGYREFWNPLVQDSIDQNIKKYRKADAVLRIKGLAPDTEVNIEQISHDFLFGGNIFLFGDCGSSENNKRYEDTFGSLFNAATIPFYWKALEPEEGKPRYEAGSSYEYRRPPTDPVVDFCESKGINMNGHAIIYAFPKWGHPTWMPEDRKKMEVYFEKHVRELAERYKGRVNRWDVVNEPINQVNRGLVPDDYTYKTFSWAMQYFPESVKFNINDCTMSYDIPTIRRYVEIIRNLTDRGIRIDNVGIQMHIFNTRSIAEGKEVLTPEKMYNVLDNLVETERPIHISEVTVAAPDESDAGKAIQAVITRNLYRLCFSYPDAMGITWWNVVDGGAAPGEPSFSGIYDKDLNPKPVYYVLDKLINEDWKTRMTLKVGEDETATFRGFKGRYVVSWKDKNGNKQQAEFYLKNDGDGFNSFQ